MANKKKAVSKPDEQSVDIPKELSSLNFYGLELDDDQKSFIENIFSPDVDIVFCNARSGSGKTTCALGASKILVKSGLFKEIQYLMIPHSEKEQRCGYRPGTTEEKLTPYFMPLYGVASTLDINPYTDINAPSDDWQPAGGGYISCVTDIWMRGRTIAPGTILIIDEMQNGFVDQIKTILTRTTDGCKVICIGQKEQCDLIHNANKSGFVPYLEHFKDQPRCAICELHTNHRGWISTWADSLES